jgi:4-alpha-glucanotransferase
VLGREEIEGTEYVRLRLGMPPSGRWPAGYHTLRLGAGGRTATSMLISAPMRVHAAPSPRSWGVFIPLYALHSARSWGPGDLTDLRALVEWAAGLGGDVVGTLPLLAAFLDAPFEPSPYSPASRLFWNELYLDPTGLPGFERSAEARRVVGSAGFRRRLDALRSAPLVDYREAAALRRRVLEILARDLFAGRATGEREALEAFRRANPAVEDYARFRAACRRHGAGWSTWPRAEREGVLPEDGGDEAERRYHLFVQWAAREQMDALATAAERRGSRLYFDLPLGVHPEGYDVWRHREAFVSGASAGAPPDFFFGSGQNWGFPPIHPDGERERGYPYFRACIENLFRPAGVARIDHVMGLHRIFMIPWGLTPGDGVYVRYRPEELYAMLALESRRHATAVVGEDLGTVPAPVRTAMRRHGIHRSFVLEFELKPNKRRAVRRPPPLSTATIGTHDTPTFAAFWRGRDVRLRLAQGWISHEHAARELARRDRTRRAVVEYLRGRGSLRGGTRVPSDSAVLRALLEELAGSDAAMLVVALEDLWLEPRPQNVPGTTDLFPNWRRPARYSLEEFSTRRSLTEPLSRVDGLRSGRVPSGAGGRVGRSTSGRRGPIDGRT